VALITLSIVFPTVLQPLKMILLAIITVSLLLSPETWTTRSSYAQIALDLLAIAFTCIGLIWGILGVLRGNPGAVPMLPVHALYPVLFMFLCRLARPGDLYLLSKVLWVAAALTVAEQALFLGSFFGLDGGIVFQKLVEAFNENTAAVDVGDDYVLFTLPTVSSLLFLAPWLCVYAILGEKGRTSSGLLLLLVIGILILSGRRVFLLAFAVGVAFAFLAARPLIQGRGRLGGILSRLVLLTVAISLFVSLGFVFELFNFDLLRDRVMSTFDFEIYESNIVRRLQSDALLGAIGERPAFGSGLGAVASYVRSDEQPWAYELSYVALAFQFGLVGFALYACGVSFLFVQLGRLASRPQLQKSERISAVCFVAGLAAFILANATNPYLAKFDYMWIIFVPLAFVRLYMPALFPGRLPLTTTR